VILVGERLAEVPGALSAAARLAAVTGARLAWIPRRAGERGAIEAGALPNLLPGGRQIGSAQATAEVARAWGVGSLPADPGLSTSEILAATATAPSRHCLSARSIPMTCPIRSRRSPRSRRLGSLSAWNCA